MIKIDFTKVVAEEEKLFLKQIVEYSQKSVKQNREIYTNFYNYDWMREVICKYVGINSLPNAIFVGGYEDAERRMMGFVVDMEHIYYKPLAVLEVKINTGLGKKLNHRDYLGAMIGLGIERDKIGDIIIKSFGAYLIVHEDVKEYIRWNLNQIARYTKIQIQEIDFEVVEIDSPKTKEINGTISSIRADSIVALAFGLSRTNASKILKADKGRCNGMPLSATRLLKEKDVITVRGYGKMRVLSFNGKTKKDRIHVTVEKYI